MWRDMAKLIVKNYKVFELTIKSAFVIIKSFDTSKVGQIEELASRHKEF